MDGITNTTKFGLESENQKNTVFDIKETSSTTDASVKENTISLDTSQVTGENYIKFTSEHGTENGSYTVVSAIRSIKLYYKNTLTLEIKKDLIPNMTSDTAPSGTVEASGTYSGRQAWWAFSGTAPNSYTGAGYWCCIGSTNPWLSYTWDSAVKIQNISFCRVGSASQELQVQYLKDNDWIDIASFGAVTDNSTYYHYDEIKLDGNNIIETTAIRFLVNGEAEIGDVHVYEIKKQSL